MRYFTPAKIITPTEAISAEELYQLLLTQMKASVLFKPMDSYADYPTAKLYSKGDPWTAWFSDLLPLWHYEGYYFCLIELDEEENRIIYSLQNFSYRKTPEELELYLPPLEALPSPLASISDWLEASTLPKTLLSNGTTFMKKRGLKALL